MDMQLRVVQFYRMVEGERFWEGYELQVMTAEGWVPVPVVMQEVENERVATRIPVIYEAGIMKC